MSSVSEQRQKYDSWPFRLCYRGCLRPAPLVREREGTRGSWLGAPHGWRSLRGVCSCGLASKPPSGAPVVQGRTGCSAPCSAHPTWVLPSTPGCQSRPGSAGGRTWGKGCPPLPPPVHISLWLKESSLSILAAKTSSWPRGNGALRLCGSGSRCWKWLPCKPSSHTGAILCWRPTSSSMEQGQWQPSCPLLCTAPGWPLPGPWGPCYRGCGAENAPCSLRSDTPPTLQVKPYVFPTQQPMGSQKKSWGGSLMGQEHSPFLVLCPGDRNAPK